jgi:hypothetical protein
VSWRVSAVAYKSVIYETHREFDGAVSARVRIALTRACAAGAGGLRLILRRRAWWSRAEEREAAVGRQWRQHVEASEQGES